MPPIVPQHDTRRRTYAEILSADNSSAAWSEDDVDRQDHLDEVGTNTVGRMSGRESERHNLWSRSDDAWHIHAEDQGHDTSIGQGAAVQGDEREGSSLLASRTDPSTGSTIQGQSLRSALMIERELFALRRDSDSLLRGAREDRGGESGQRGASSRLDVTDYADLLRDPESGQTYVPPATSTSLPSLGLRRVRSIPFPPRHTTSSSAPGLPRATASTSSSSSIDRQTPVDASSTSLPLASQTYRSRILSRDPSRRLMAADAAADASSTGTRSPSSTDGRDIPRSTGATTTNAQGDRPWRRMFLHPNRPLRQSDSDDLDPPVGHASFDEYDYLDSLPGLAEFAEDAGLGAALPRPNGARSSVGTAAALERGGNNRRRVSVRRSNGAIDRDEINLAAVQAFTNPRTSAVQSGLPATNTEAQPTPAVITRVDDLPESPFHLSSPPSSSSRIRPRSASAPSSPINKRRRLGNISPPPHDPSPIVPPAPPAPSSHAYPSYLSYFPHCDRSSLPCLFPKAAFDSNLAVRLIPAPAPSTARRQVITFTDHPPPHDDDKDACAILASAPIPPGLGVYYYEIKVTDTGPKGYMSVGFMKADSDLKRLVGWEKGTWGYHADDGLIFEGSGKGKAFGPTWTVGDVIGAGIDSVRKRVFFTKNGVLLGHGSLPIIPNLHPAIALRNVEEQFEVNLLGPFMYDIDRHVLEGKERVMKDLNSTRVDEYPRLADRYVAHDVAAKESAEVGMDEMFTEPASHADAAGLAMVLEHLSHRGLSKVVEMVKRDVGNRKLFKSASNTRTSQETAGASVDSETADDKSQVSIGRQVYLAQKGITPDNLAKYYTLYINSDDSATLSARLHIIDFVYQILHPPINEAQVGPEEIHIDTETDTESDHLTELVKAGRRLSTLANTSAWSEDMSSLMHEAFGLVALSPPLPDHVAKVWQQRRDDWMSELKEAIRIKLGQPKWSLLEMALLQTREQLRVLRDKGDGRAGYVDVEQVVFGRGE